MSHAFVTGANGFVAAHVIKLLFERNYRVTSSVRSESKVAAVYENDPQYKGKVNLVVIPDMTRPDAWDEVLRNNDFDYIIHVAAPVLDQKDNVDFDRDFLEPSVKGGVNLLEAARKYGNKIQHITITGSIVSVADMINTKDIISAEDWSPVTLEEARKQQDSAYSYRASKKFAEKAIWEYVKEHKLDYTVSVLLPSLIFGPPIQPISSMKSLNFTPNMIYGFFNGTHKVTPPTALPIFTAYVDVRDLAEAHIKALTSSTAANQRLLLSPGVFTNEKLVQVIYDRFPSLRDRLSKNENQENVVPAKFDLSKTEALGIKYTSFEDTIVDTVKRLLELEKKLNGQ